MKTYPEPKNFFFCSVVLLNFIFLAKQRLTELYYFVQRQYKIHICEMKNEKVSNLFHIQKTAGCGVTDTAHTEGLKLSANIILNLTYY